MQVTLSPSRPEDYSRFLKIKALPKSRFIGRTAEFPDEYRHLIDGVDAVPGAYGRYSPLPGLFDYQQAISEIAIRKRKFAAFVRPGLGKTLIEAEFSRHAGEQLPTDKCVLAISPPNVIPQWVDEVRRFYGDALPVERIPADKLAAWLESGTSRFGITNYEALKDSTPQGRLGALVCDESSIFKSFSGKWGQICLRLGRGLEWKFCGTGTPAPNDRIEYANHAVFLDAFPTVNSFLARFFVNRGETQNRWELKPHALGPFYRALSHWCIFVSNPAVYGWKDNAGTLPPIHIHEHDVPLTQRQRDLLMEFTGTLTGQAGGIGSRSVISQICKGNFRGEEVPTNKADYVRDLVAGWRGEESTLVWCIYNREQDMIEAAMPDAASMRGETKYDVRQRMIADFKAGRVRELVSKAEVLGWGLNLQVATRQVFSGIEDSHEQFFQCLCRSNRVGSTRPLNAHVPLTSAERPMFDTVMRKARRIEEDTREQERLFKESAADCLI